MPAFDPWPAAYLLTASQVADILHMDRDTVAAAIRAGQLPAVQIASRWYVPAGRLRAWLGLPPVAGLEPPAASRVRFGR